MKSGFQRLTRLALKSGLLLVIFGLVVGGSFIRGTLAQQPDGRPRSVEGQRSGAPTLPRATPTPSPSPSPAASPSGTPEGGEVDPDETIRIDSQLVVLNVRVIDRNNRPINNVRTDEFKVFEDGVAQPIQSVTKEEVPISYGLAVDTSGSLRSQINQVIDAAKTIISSNKEGDETFLMRFIDREKIETMQEFTANKDDLVDAVDKLYVEGGQTAVIDAVYLAAEHIAEYKKNNDGDRRRRALILVTDGEDRASFYNKEQLFQRLREEDVQIYIIGFVNELSSESGLIRKSGRDKAVDLLDRMAKETGGRVFYPKSVAELPAIADEITQDMRTQYVVAYDPTNKATDGTFRSIKVSVVDAPGKDKRIALTRSGRTVPKEGSAPNKRPAPGASKPTQVGNVRP